MSERAIEGSTPDRPPLCSPEPLSPIHAVSEFECGVASLNDFIRRHALANQFGGASRTYVATRGGVVVAYYSLAPASVSHEGVPTHVAKGQARHDVPVILLARLAVDVTEQGRGLGRAILRDALVRAVQGAAVIGGRAIAVHAVNEAAADFYCHWGFETAPHNRRHLFLLFKDVRKAIGP